MRMPFMGPSKEEVVATATDLISRFGFHALDEAKHLEEVAVRLHSRRNRNLYLRAAREIEKSSLEPQARRKQEPDTKSRKA